MQYRTRGTKGVGDPVGAASRVPRTNSGDLSFERCEAKSVFQGAGGSADAVGAVVDMLRRIRERRWDATREAMVAVKKLFICVCEFVRWKDCEGVQVFPEWYGVCMCVFDACRSVSTTAGMMSSSSTCCRVNEVKPFCFAQTNASDFTTRMLSSRSANHTCLFRASMCEMRQAVGL